MVPRLNVKPQVVLLSQYFGDGLDEEAGGMEIGRTILQPRGTTCYQWSADIFRVQ